MHPRVVASAAAPASISSHTHHRQSRRCPRRHRRRRHRHHRRHRRHRHPRRRRRHHCHRRRRRHSHCRVRTHHRHIATPCEISLPPSPRRLVGGHVAPTAGESSDLVAPISTAVGGHVAAMAIYTAGCESSSPPSPHPRSCTGSRPAAATLAAATAAAATIAAVAPFPPP